MSKTQRRSSDNRIGAYELDANDSFTINASFDNGAIGVIHSSRWASGHRNELCLRIYGDKGGLEVKCWRGGHLVADQRYTSLRASRGHDLETSTWRDIPIRPVPLNYQHFVEAVRRGQNLEPSFATATRLQQILDTCFRSHTENMAFSVDEFSL